MSHYQKGVGIIWDIGPIALPTSLGQKTNSGHPKVNVSLVDIGPTTMVMNEESTTSDQWLERLVEETTDLERRIMNLDVFIDTSSVFAGLSSDKQSQLKLQRKVMGQYLALLLARLNDES